MTISNISAAQYLSGKLRYGVHNGDLIDYNSASRPSNFTHFVYPDRPRIIDLLKNKNNFPRISIESMDVSTIRRLGIGSKQYHDRIQLSINIWSPPNLTCVVSSSSGEDHTYATGTDYYELDNIPVSLIGATIDGTKDAGVFSFDRGIDYELVDNNYDGFYDSVHWLGEDEPDDATVFTCAYNRKAAGDELVRIIGKDVHNYIRENWITWMGEDGELNNYRVISSRPVAFNPPQNVNRYEMFINFTGINTGNSI